MSASLELRSLDLCALEQLAQRLALFVQPGDFIALHGDLGAGKTTFARALVGALSGSPVEVQSPTFPIVLDYATPRLHVRHFDLYRLSDASELDELGFADEQASSLTLVEWPEHAATALPAGRLEVHLAESDGPGERHVHLAGHGDWVERVDRLRNMLEFLEASGWGSALVAHMQGDASTRSYARLARDGQTAVLMNAPRQPDGPPVRDGMAYSHIAHLAEDIRPFVAVDVWLRQHGISAPEILAQDIDTGFLILEDLGSRDFATEMRAGTPQATLWRSAVDVLVELRRAAVPEHLPLPDATTYTLPRFNRAALEIEVSLLVDWFWPEVKGAPIPQLERQAYEALWRPVLDEILTQPPGLFLRDFHSPNLLWLPQRDGVARVGVLDFQDALREPHAFDLASLLQDARVDVPADLEAELLDHYCTEVEKRAPSFDRAAFMRTYAIFGAQRNARLIGLWVRLLRRDGKPQYLAHLPRTWRYLERNLARSGLADLERWLAHHLPVDLRQVPLVLGRYN
jgi:hypothetical protein